MIEIPAHDIQIRDLISMALMIAAGTTVGAFDQLWMVLAVGGPLIVVGALIHSPSGDRGGPT